MDTRDSHPQPSNLSLLVIALLCGFTIFWAYQDRTERKRLACESSGNDAAQSLDAPAFEPWLPDEVTLDAPGVLNSEDRVAIVPENLAATPLYLDPSQRLEPVRLPTPILTTEVPSDGVSIELEAPSLTTDVDTLDTPPLPLTPEDLAVEERSVLIEGDASPTELSPELSAQPTMSLAETEERRPEPVFEDHQPDYDDDAAIAAADTAHEELLTYTPAATEISLRVAPDVQAAFALGRHGALYAARQKFIEAMEVIAAAKDGELSTDRHTNALAEGLGALEEAQDFLPGGAVSKELSVAEAAASHHTPMLRGTDRARWTLPHEAAALYYRFAEQKLARSVEGEQAGSMALYGLGKTYTQLHVIDGEVADQQKAMAMHRAALLAHGGNHLAANELGVGLAKVGHYGKAAAALEQSIAHGGGSTVYRNLAHVQHKLGQARLAAATSDRAERLAMQERAAGLFSRERGVQWVTPDRFASRPSVSPPAGPRAAGAPMAAAQQPPEPKSISPFGGVARFAKRIVTGQPGPVRPAPYNGPAPQFQANRSAAPIASQTTIRR